MSPAAAAEEGLYRRLADDATLAGLLGPGTRIVPGWSAETEDAADFPRITFYVFGPSPTRPGFQRVRATLDEWVWPTGAAGGRPKLLQVDARLVEILDEERWTYEGHRIDSQAGGFRDFPAPPGAPLRRMREIIIEASPLA